MALPMSIATVIPAATYADLEALPANLVGQILYGVLHAHPRPSPRHLRASSELGFELIGPFGRGRGGPGGWIILDEAELHLGIEPERHVIVPDLAGWRLERMPELPDEAHFKLPPDWVCEILSPSTARIDRTDKLAIYAEFGVGHAWYVDPAAKTLEVLALNNGRWTILSTHKDNDPISAPPFEAHTWELGVLWG